VLRRASLKATIATKRRNCAERAGPCWLQYRRRKKRARRIEHFVASGEVENYAASENQQQAMTLKGQFTAPRFWNRPPPFANRIARKSTDAA
jgi:hypothetical protein